MSGSVNRKDEHIEEIYTGGNSPCNASRSFVHPAVSACPSAFTAGALCLSRPDKAYKTLERSFGVDMDGARKWVSAGTGFSFRYWKRNCKSGWSRKS